LGVRREGGKDDLPPSPLRPAPYSLYIRLVPLVEKALIAKLRRLIRRSPTAVRVGIGDDCAVIHVPDGHEALVTTDFSLEGIHFRREWHPPDSIGHRCLARGLSDIAAMGGTPIAAFLSLALPADLPQRWVDEFMRGLQKLARDFRVALAGGDTAQSPDGILADIVVLGSVPKQRAILRSGARAGDRIYVTGELGASAAAINRFLAGKKTPSPSEYPRHFYPVPRIGVGRFVRDHAIASAMIDISDGLSTDLGHICEESGVGADIMADEIPCSSVGKSAAKVDLDSALHGGDDYELLFTARSKTQVPRRIAGVRITEIGRVTKAAGMFLLNNQRRSKLIPRGWEHFRQGT
jgi:thiamine-monophosphate kinase